MSPWSGRPLEQAGQKLADDIGCNADDLRLLADAQGHVSDAVAQDLRTGGDVAEKLARDLDLDADGTQRMSQIVTGYMLRRVRMRAAFQGTSVTAQAIDDAVRSDALQTAEMNLDARAKDAVASVLPGLPDLTARVAAPTP